MMKGAYTTHTHGLGIRQAGRDIVTIWRSLHPSPSVSSSPSSSPSPFIREQSPILDATSTEGPPFLFLVLPQSRIKEGRERGERPETRGQGAAFRIRREKVEEQEGDLRMGELCDRPRAPRMWMEGGGQNVHLAKGYCDLSL